MAFLEILKSVLVLAAGAAMVYLFFLGIYRNLRWRFPRLSPLWFGLGAALLTVSISAGTIWFYSRPDVNCGLTEVVIVRSANGDPVRQLLGSERPNPADLNKAARFCRTFWQDCTTWQSERTARVEQICTEVTAFDAER